MSSTYRPVACDYYSELELTCLSRKRCTIHYHDDAGREFETLARITDLVTRDAQEFAVLDDGGEIRLDRLISVDGKRRADYGEE